MSAAFPIDHRLALVAFAALLIAAAAPLASAWARLLPEEPPPFEVPAPSSAEQTPSNRETRPKGDPFAIFLLLCVTLSFLLKFPGLPVAAALQILSVRMPPEDFNWLVLGARVFFVAVPWCCPRFSAHRPDPRRLPTLIVGL